MTGVAGTQRGPGVIARPAHSSRAAAGDFAASGGPVQRTCSRTRPAAPARSEPPWEAPGTPRATPARVRSLPP